MMPVPSPSVPEHFNLIRCAQARTCLTKRMQEHRKLHVSLLEARFQFAFCSCDSFERRRSSLPMCNRRASMACG